MGALAISERIGTTGKIAAIEPDIDCFNLLKLNTESNKGHNIIPLHYAIWNENKVMQFHKGSYQSNSLVKEVIGSNLKTYDVKAIKIDTLVEELNWERVDYISLTINGAEPEALIGALNVFENNEKVRLSICGWYERDGVKIEKIGTKYYGKIVWLRDPIDPKTKKIKMLALI